MPALLDRKAPPRGRLRKPHVAMIVATLPLQEGHGPPEGHGPADVVPILESLAGRVRPFGLKIFDERQFREQVIDVDARPQDPSIGSLRKTTRFAAQETGIEARLAAQEPADALRRFLGLQKEVIKEHVQEFPGIGRLEDGGVPGPHPQQQRILDDGYVSCRIKPKRGECLRAVSRVRCP